MKYAAVTRIGQCKMCTLTLIEICQAMCDNMVTFLHIWHIKQKLDCEIVNYYM